MSRYYRRYRANGTVRTVTTILIAVLALGLVFSMADGFSIGGLSLTYNGSKVDDGTSLLLPQDVQLRFDVKKGLAAVPRSDYNISIIPYGNGTYMVRFTVPGDPDAKPLSLTVSSSALMVNMISGDPVTIFDKTGYVNADYQEISFGDTPQAVPQSFYIWLINNATLQ